MTTRGGCGDEDVCAPRTIVSLNKSAKPVLCAAVHAPRSIISDKPFASCMFTVDLVIFTCSRSLLFDDDVIWVVGGLKRRH